MVDIGCKLMSELNGPLELVEQAKMAEDAGFGFVNLSDHYHPWTRSQGHSPFAWCVIGGIAQATERIQVSTGVTCPTMRYHPAMAAQMAATAAVMLPGRFVFGIGTGENLNEHVIGDQFPTSIDVRLEMLREAVDIIRTLWDGGMQDYPGRFYTVVNAEIFDIPAEPIPILMGVEGVKAAGVAGEIADGIIHVPQENPQEVLEAFRSSGGEGKPCMYEIAVCYGTNEQEAKRMAYERFPIAANKGGLNWITPTPTDFEALQQMVTPDVVARQVVVGADPSRYVEKIEEGLQMGFDRVTVNNVGLDQQGFFRFMQEEVLPDVWGAAVAAAGPVAARTR